MTNTDYGTILTDMETGYKAFRRKVIGGTTTSLKSPLPSLQRLLAGKIKLADAFAAVWTLLKYRFME